VIPVVTGTAHKTGEHLFVVDPRRPAVPGVRLAMIESIALNGGDQLRS
jgi:hypothetical protein